MCQNQQLFESASDAASVSTANSNLDGTGTMALVLTGANDGTSVQNITIKAAGNNSQGMLRFFIKPNGYAGNPYLWREIPVPANIQSETIPAFQTTVRAGYILKSGDELYASTQVGDIWNIIVEAVTWTNCGCPS